MRFRFVPSPGLVAAPAPWLAVLLLVVVGALAYLNSLRVPLLFDDLLALHSNPSITELRKLGAVLAPPHTAPTAGRPLLNLSYAVNHALHGHAVEGYHVFNLAVHVLATLALFGLVRRTIEHVAAGVPASGEANRQAGTPAAPPGLVASRATIPAVTFAFATAAVWTAHPLHTGAVTYVSQRAETLMALFYLLTLYCFVRSARQPRENAWSWLSVAACVAGALCKENIATAPLLVLLLDRTFFSGTFRAALAQRGRYYAALAGTWLVLAVLIFTTRIGERGVGFGGDVGPFTYALTQARVVLAYLKLALWPFPLVFDYGADVMAKSLREVLPQLVAILGLLIGTGFALQRNKIAGLLAAAFFLILAPTSSVVPVIHQPMAENRMYLPLAPFCALLVAGIWTATRGRACLPLALLALGLIGLTVRRNYDYRSAVAIWQDTVAKRPRNLRAHNQLAEALMRAGDREEGIRHSRIALQLDPKNDVALNNLGIMLAPDPQTLDEAVEHFEAAARVRPGFAPVLANLGNALIRIPGREQEGIRVLRDAVAADPGYADAHLGLGSALLTRGGNAAEAVRHYAEAARLRPKDVKAHTNLGVALAALRRYDDAIRHCRIALQLEPDYADAHVNLANALLQLPGRQAEAIAHARRAIELRPAFAEAWLNLGVAYATLPGYENEGIAALTEALRLQPTLTRALPLLEQMRNRAKQRTEPR